ncbi:MAG: ADP-heptose synthase / D-glycero-beta-D-manno-heptose 7-phosphate kinase [uncultured Rubrobacteraceae bacterium]|uniref:ADP-heptose synthase / D-glycero-beta-D-manno-heptose 7-phosphate kinase n=1 Tax=uncultured Rubrobacteraceae bacterium TaxID=349277 RepID=A0A6J4RBR1_9ACTN|nr:MAG: ADP-heptose synthase / D-glycero-beta-D-manno-heptose 7-phosphate kinase [uncultured Rubrobacteraceae bacterium]
MREGHHSLATLVRAFRGRRCLVVGDVMLDVFERGRAEKLAPDVPAPVVTGIRRTSSPGGAANVAANLAAMGAGVTLLSAVGDDDPGLELLEKLSGAGVETGEVVREPGRATVVKRRLIADGVILARVDSGDTNPPPKAAKLAERARSMAAASDTVLVSDYAGGTVTRGLAEALGGSGHPCVVLDSKRPLRLSWRGLAAATPNHLEAQKALDLPVETDPRRIDAAGVGRALRRRLGARVVAVTLAEHGVAVAGPGGVESIAGRFVDEPDVNGAGDTFLAAFALALGGGAGAAEAARLGVEAATLAVLRPGTVPIAADDLLRRLREDPRESGGASGLEADLDRTRERGGRVVFTSGRFDPPRREHLRKLREARELGDLLVVGLLPGTEDTGPASHIALPLEDRAELLSSLSFVDHVVVLDGEPPGDVARRLGADVFVPGEETRGDANGLDAEAPIAPARSEGPSCDNGSSRNAATTDDEGGSAAEDTAETRL